MIFGFEIGCSILLNSVGLISVGIFDHFRVIRNTAVVLAAKGQFDRTLVYDFIQVITRTERTLVNACHTCGNGYADHLTTGKRRFSNSSNIVGDLDSAKAATTVKCLRNVLNTGWKNNTFQIITCLEHTAIQLCNTIRENHAL